MDSGPESPREDRWRRWQHAAVRDLAWVLASPPLLAPTCQDSPANHSKIRWLGTAWSDLAYAASEEWLAELDRHPGPLLASLACRPDRRLGSYFENLLSFWLSWPANPLYRLLGHGLPVRVDNRTLGELDFLVEDRSSGEIQHWEVAVKFYLGIRAGREHENWIGPGLRDRLDLKVKHLSAHQLALAATSAGARLIREMGLAPPLPVCLLKGRLFYPPEADWHTWAPAAASADHPTAWWMAQADFLARYGGTRLRWIRLPKEHWLTPVQADAAGNVPIGDGQSTSAFIETLEQSADNRAIAVVGLLCNTEGRYQEATRGFVTPPQWPNAEEPQLPDSTLKGGS